MTKTNKDNKKNKNKKDEKKDLDMPTLTLQGDVPKKNSNISKEGGDKDWSDYEKHFTADDFVQ